MQIPINLVFEDDLSEYVMTRLLDFFEGKYMICNSYSGNGFGYIKKNINGFNQASSGIPFFVLTDLDSYPCPVQLKNEWMQESPKPNFIFRIAVREVEAWLLADIKNLSKFINVSATNFPTNPEQEIDPKRCLINLARRSRKREIREDIVPINDNASIGPNYNGRLMDFVFKHWDINLAKENCDSLLSTIKKLDSFKYLLASS
jgi:hypothetical protein